MAPSSRRGRRPAASLGVLAVLTAMGSVASAHRLDEYLQAARISIADSRVDVELSLTPGVAVADSVIGEMDRDRDGSLSTSEREGYASTVVSRLRLQIDGRPLKLELIGGDFPDVAAMRRGEASIRLQLIAALPSSSGAHQLFFRNDHRSDVSVYLANAMRPAGDQPEILAQRRDRDQHELTIDYIEHTELARSAWLLCGLGGFTMIVLLVPNLKRIFV